MGGKKYLKLIFLTALNATVPTFVKQILKNIMIVIRGIMVVKSKGWTKLNRFPTRVECWKYTGSLVW